MTIMNTVSKKLNQKDIKIPNILKVTLRWRMQAPLNSHLNKLASNRLICNKMLLISFCPKRSFTLPLI